MRREHDPLTERVIGLAIEVHRILGPGLQESVYESALHYELQNAGVHCGRQVPIEVTYKGVRMGVGFRVVLLVERLTELHTAQLLSYLNLLQQKRGLLLNFNARPLKNGIRRISR